MKIKILNIRTIIFIALAIALIGLYQTYWLVNYYYELETQLNGDIQEVLRSSDFEELAHRVNEISKMNTFNRVDVNLGYDHEEKNSITRSRVTSIEEERENEQHLGTHTVVSANNFGNILKSPEDLMGIGLNMQRGIHSSLDGIMDVDIEYLDSIISKKLDSIGVGTIHRLLYICNADQENNLVSERKDTLAKLGIPEMIHPKTFSLKISDVSEYQMIIPHYSLAILNKMMPVILFSLFSLALLIITFWHLIRSMHKQRELEEIKTDFTNNITHELKTPIAVAYAANDALLNFKTESNTPRMNRYLGICQEQLRLLDRLVEQILSLSMERNKPLLLNRESINLRQLVVTLVNSFKLKYPKVADIKIDIEERLYITTDGIHFSNIMSNLIDNAIKYSKMPVEIKISASEDVQGDIIVEVKDNGIGITKDQQKFIFDRFYRVPHGNIHDVKGYGLGLYYVKSMIEKLGGTISVKSSYGKGSIFKLVLKKDYERQNQNTISRG